MATALIEEYYLNLLHAGRCEGNVFYLPEEVGIGKPGQLSRESYVAASEILTRRGGKGNRKAGGHVFEDDPKPLMLLIFETGEMPPKNPTAFYATPPEVAEQLLRVLGPRSLPFRSDGTSIVLEPSAGTGALIDAIRELPNGAHYSIHCCEILPKFQEKLRAAGHNLVAED